jgi:cyclase
MTLARILLIAFSLGSIPTSVVNAGEVVGVTEVTPNLIILATASGNVVTSVGPDGALLVGTPSAESTDQINSILAKRTKSAIRYVVIAPEDVAHSDGDAGWQSRGAFVAMQELALERLGGHAMGSPKPLPARLISLGVDRPRIAFSEVLTFDLNGEAIHLIHQTPGYSNADAVAHFHVANLVYFGEVFPGDGYPEINFEMGGKLEGITKTLESWADNTVRVVPARGKITNGAEVSEFLKMIATIRDRIQGMIGAGMTEQQVLAARPSAEFDARWGRGRVSPDSFVRTVYRSLRPS